MSRDRRNVLQTARERLAGHVDTPDADARILLTELLGLTATDLITGRGEAVTDDEWRRLDAALTRRLAGEPVYRIIGRRAFHGVELQLSAETLEPRPDTETLVDATIDRAKTIVSQTGACRILDLGTGTGAILLALLAAVPGATGTGTDISADALATARKNAELNGLADRFTAIQGSWFDSVSGHFDMIVSNPPYIPSAAIAGLSREVRDHDPRAALDGGDDGLDAYRAIASSAPGHLSRKGIVALEIGAGQAADVTAIFRSAGFEPVSSHADLGGVMRVLTFACEA